MEKLAVISGVGVELEVQGANQVTCTSLSVAEVFNKNHKNIIRKINKFPKDNFTGEKAYKWRLAFINAFNEMEKRLKNIKAEQMQKLAFRQSLGYKSQFKQ